MSRENVEIIREGYERFIASGEFPEDITDPDFVWDMSTFRDWPEQKTYPGLEGARQFMRDWLDAWNDWEVEVERYEDAGDKVVAVVRQRGTSKMTGLEVDMSLAQVFTLRDGKQVRMQMYADVDEALEAVGLATG